MIAILILYFAGFTAFWYFLLYPKTEKKERPPDTKQPAVPPKKAKPPGPAARLGRLIAPIGYIEFLRKQLLYAGSPREFNIERILGLKLMLAGLAAVLVAPLLLAGASLFWRLLISIALIVAAFFIPDVWLNGRADRRQKQISRDLPDMLDLLTVSVEAGLGFDAALGKVVENAKGLLAEEFFRLLQEIQLGVSRRQAFSNLSERTYAPELRYFISSVLQADAYGISIGKVLRAKSEEMKEKRRQKAEEAAIKAPVKIIFPLVLCIFPALLIVILGPALISIVQTLSQVGR